MPGWSILAAWHIGPQTTLVNRDLEVRRATNGSARTDMLRLRPSSFEWRYQEGQDSHLT